MLDKGWEVIGADQGVGIKIDENRIGRMVIEARQSQVGADFPRQTDPTSLARHFQAGRGCVHPGEVHLCQGRIGDGQAVQGGMIIRLVWSGGIRPVIDHYQNQEPVE